MPTYINPDAIIDHSITSVKLAEGINIGNSKVFYGVCDTSADTADKVVTCNSFSVDDLVDGVMVSVKFDYTNSAAVDTITLAVNDTSAYPIKKIYGTTSSNAGIKNLYQVGELAADAVIPFVFTGQYWLVAGVDMNVNTTYTMNYSVDSGQYKAGNGTYAVTRYSLLMEKPDETWEKITSTDATYTTATTKTVNTSGFLLNRIRYYGTTAIKADGALIATNVCYRKAASVDMRYSTNCGASPGWAVSDYIYLVGTLGSDGLFYLDTTTWWSNALPSTNDGKLYIRLGLVLANSNGDPTYNISFFDDRPIFYHDGTALRRYIVADNKQDVISDLDTIRANASAGAAKVSNVQADWNASTGLAAILNKPTIPTEVTENTVSGWGFTKNAGTITGITMNGNSMGTSGIVDLGTVLTTAPDISGKADSSVAIGSLSLSINSTNYQITLSGTKVDGTPFTVSNVIDLPLESVVVDGSYNNSTKKVVLTLQNGSSIDFSVADLVSGLQSEITTSNKLSADLISDGTTNKTVTATEKSTWNGKQDAISDLATIRANASEGAAKVSNVQADWDATTGLSLILNKPELSKIYNAVIDHTHSETNRVFLNIDNYGGNNGAIIVVCNDSNVDYSGTRSLWFHINETDFSDPVTTGYFAYDGFGTQILQLPKRSIYVFSFMVIDGSERLISGDSHPIVNDSNLIIRKNGVDVSSIELNGNQSILFSANVNRDVIYDISVNELPDVSTADNGKIMMVVNGQWSMVDPVAIYSGDGDPSNNLGKNGDLYLKTGK